MVIMMIICGDDVTMNMIMITTVTMIMMVSSNDGNSAYVYDYGDDGEYDLLMIMLWVPRRVLVTGAKVCAPLSTVKAKATRKSSLCGGCCMAPPRNPGYPTNKVFVTPRHINCWVLYPHASRNAQLML